jgi:hypothetical protein
MSNRHKIRYPHVRNEITRGSWGAVHAFLTWELNAEWSASLSGRFTYGERARHTPLTGSPAAHRTGLRVLDVTKLFPFREPKVSSFFQTVLKSSNWANLTSNILRLCVIKYNRNILLHSKTPSDVSSVHKLVYHISCKDYRTPVPWSREWWFTTPQEESPVKYVIHQ